MFKGLSLHQAPPYKAVERFFLTAPIIGIIAGVVIFFTNPDAFLHRLTPQNLAIVHLLTLGFISMVMVGAMQQMLPVIAGVDFTNPTRNARVIHTLLLIGTGLFFVGFYYSIYPALQGGVVALVIAFLWFIVVVFTELLKVDNKSESVRAFEYGFISLFIAIIFGAITAFSYAGIGSYNAIFANLHITWIFLGWVTLLIIGVGFQVVPMFYVTRKFPRFCRKRGIFWILASLFIYSLFLYLQTPNFLFMIFKILVFLLAIGFAVITILRLKKRKRAIKETTITYWYIAMSSFVVGLIIWSVGFHMHLAQIEMLSGIVLGFGFLISLINGMLYKIVPFLVWFHLTNSGYFNVPTTKSLIKEKTALLQLKIHMASFFFFVMANVLTINVFYQYGAIFFVASNLLLFFNLYHCSKVYYKTIK